MPIIRRIKQRSLSLRILMIGVKSHSVDTKQPLHKFEMSTKSCFSEASFSVPIDMPDIRSRGYALLNSFDAFPFQTSVYQPFTM